MDPTANLHELRDLSRGILERKLSEDPEFADHWAVTYAEELAERVQALDEWLTKGGFMPDAWKRGPEDTHDITRSLLVTLEAEAKTWDRLPYHSPELDTRNRGRAWGLRRAADLLQGRA